MFHGFEKRYFGEGHVRLDLFVSHIPSREKFDGGNMAQIRLYVKQYRIFIMIYFEISHAIFLRITHSEISVQSPRREPSEGGHL